MELELADLPPPASSQCSNDFSTFDCLTYASLNRPSCGGIGLRTPGWSVDGTPSPHPVLVLGLRKGDDMPKWALSCNFSAPFRAFFQYLCDAAMHIQGELRWPSLLAFFQSLGTTYINIYI